MNPKKGQGDFLKRERSGWRGTHLHLRQCSEEGARKLLTSQPRKASNDQGCSVILVGLCSRDRISTDSCPSLPKVFLPRVGQFLEQVGPPALPDLSVRPWVMFERGQDYRVPTCSDPNLIISHSPPHSLCSRHTGPLGIYRHQAHHLGPSLCLQCPSSRQPHG